MASKHASVAKPIADFWSSLSLARRFAVVTAVLIVATAIIQAAVVLGVSSYIVSRLQGERVGNRLSAASRHIGSHIEEFRKLPLVLANTPPIAHIADISSGEAQPRPDESLAAWRGHLGTLFRSIMQLTPGLQQARFIGIADGGREIVRVVRTKNGVTMVTETKLERKAERPYFQATIQMRPGDIYMSPAGANPEADPELQRPMMLAATPVFSSSGRPFGLIVVNAAPEAWVQNLAEVAGVSDRFVVANHAGAYVHRSEAGRSLGPLQHSSGLFQKDWPELAPIFKSEGPDKLTVHKDGHVVSASRIAFNPSEPDQFLVLATDSDSTAVFGDTWKLILLGIVLAFALAGVGVSAAYLVSRPLKRLTSAAREIAQGTGAAALDSGGPAPDVGELGEALRIMKEAVKIRDDSLRNSEAHLRAIVDNTIDGLITIDRRGIIQRYNPACEHIFGYKASEALGQDMTLLMPRAEAQEFSDAMQRYWRTGNADFTDVRREITGRHKSGQLIDLELAFAEIKVEDEVLFTGVIRDITERKRIERLKAEFVSSVTHELRTPLTSIMGSLGLLRAGKVGDLPDKALRMVNLAHDNGKRLADLINDILDIDRLEAGAMEFTQTTERLKDVIEQEALRLSKEAEAQGVAIRLADVPADIVLDTDRDRLSQVLWNLLSNAVKFSPKGGTVTVVAEMMGDKVRVIIADQGPGISEAFRPRMFQKFAQADSSDTRQKGGTGLGLAITKAIVERFGGEIGFENEPGVGTTFHFDLPARWVQEGIVAAHEPGQSEAGAAGNQMTGAPVRPHVLHVEKDPDTSAVLSEIIADVADMTAVTTLAEARGLLAEQSFDLVICDVYLEGRDGAETLQALTQASGPIPRVLVYSVDEPPLITSEVIARRLVKSRTDLLALRAHIIELLREPRTPIKRSA